MPLLHILRLVKSKRKHITLPAVSAALFALFIFSLIFSYQPSLSFGTTPEINLKLSLTLVFALLFILSSVTQLVQKIKELSKLLLTKLFLAFCVLNTLSLIWTANKTRGLFETGLIWLLFFVFVSIVVNFKVIFRKEFLLTVLWTATLTACLFSLWQFFGDAIGISPDLTLLSPTYQSTLFGVARPTGFALEPEFLGNFLIIPFLLATYLILTSIKLAVVYLIVFTTSLILLLTISRGALLAATIGVVLLLIFARQPFKRVVTLLGILVMSLGVAIGLIGLGGHINNRDDISGKSAIIGFVNQVSFGTIKIPIPHIQSPVQTTVNQLPTYIVQTVPAPTPIYVAQSTNSRLLMSKEAINLWKQNARTIVFGTGTGSFGTLIHAKNHTYATNSIVNNEYLQVLTELGIVGFILFILILAIPIWLSIKNRRVLPFAILIASYLQWLFFSGHINVIQLWVAIAVIYAYFLYSKEDTIEQAKKSGSQSIRV